MAKRLIAKDGMQCVWKKEVLTPIDVTKPWLGDTVVVTNHNVDICFVPASGGLFELIKFIQGTESPAVTTNGLMAAQTFELLKTDLVTRSGDPLKIEYINTLKPNDQVVLYILGLTG